MTDELILTTQSIEGKPLIATFLPSMGMNLISYKKGECEVIDQATRPLFDERFRWPWRLIGPHFHRRRPNTPKNSPTRVSSLIFAGQRKRGNDDSFSHGIARYAPWKLFVDSYEFFCDDFWKDSWNGVPLSQLEGQQFIMADGS